MHRARVRILIFVVLSAPVAIGAWSDLQTQPADRTAAFLARMTASQKAHGRLHESRGVGVKVLDAGYSYEKLSPTQERQPELARMQTMFCDVDSVFTGVVRTAQTFPTESGEMLFTDYAVVVDEILRRPDYLLVPKKEVIVTAPGGSLAVGAITARVAIQGFSPLAVAGSFLFFVKYHKDLDVFENAIDHGVLQIASSRLINPPPTTAVGRGPALDDVLTALRRVKCQ